MSPRSRVRTVIVLLIGIANQAHTGAVKAVKEFLTATFKPTP